ncbi:MAG: hypothetical protein NVSMB24_38880 [Mucilaginibacter sp.]
MLYKTLQEGIIMKNKITTQRPDNSDTGNKNQSDPQPPQALGNKQYRDHKSFDRSHGRVNRSPIGTNHEPGTF